MKLHGSRFRILMAVVLLHAKSGRVSVAEIQRVFKLNSWGWIYVCLRSLRDDGLIAFDSKKGGTIRPLVKFTPA